MDEQLTGIPADANERKFTGIWIPAEIWLDTNLTGLAKMLYAEIASFGDRGCWKKSDELREPLGVSSDTFQKICRQLKEAGYISERRAFGRIVRTTTLGFYSSAGNSHQPQKPADEQPEIPGDEQPQKPGVHKEYSKNKERIHINAPSAADDSKEYGRKDINDLVEFWSENIYDIRVDKNQRRQAYNLIRKYGVKGSHSLAERVLRMKQQNDRFAPNIAKISDLTGKYSKLDKLEAWEQRQGSAEPTTYVAPPPYYRPADSDYNGAWREIPDDEREQTRKIIAEARERLGFKREEQ